MYISGFCFILLRKRVLPPQSKVLLSRGKTLLSKGKVLFFLSKTLPSWGKTLLHHGKVLLIGSKRSFQRGKALLTMSKVSQDAKCILVRLWITWLQLVRLGVLSIKIKGYICGEKNNEKNIKV